MRQVLSDLTVIELAEGVAGAYCTKVFADLGAEVIKVEYPGGDPLRADLGGFAHLNLNKRGVTADPSSAGDRETLGRLLGRADLVVETAGAGCLAEWGTSAEEIRRQFPALVVATISGFGGTGPYAGYRWSNLVAQAFAGVLVAVGAGEAPVKLPANTELCAVGHTAAVGALAAVERSRATGEGAWVDCAAYEALGGRPHRILNQLGYEYRGKQVPAPETSATPAAGTGTLLPLGIFPCADGYVSIMTTPQNLPRMLDVLDDDPLRARFSQPGAFLDPASKEHLDSVLYPWLLEHPRREVMDLAQGAGWPVTAVNLPAEILEAAHLHQRGFWTGVDDPAAGWISVPGPLSRHSEGGWQLRRPAPRPGGDPAEAERTIAERTIAERTQAERTIAERASDRAPATAISPEAPPLKGVRVLDLTNVWSGPFVTLLLADLGAEVIRVESPLVFPPSAKGFEPRPRTEMVLGSIMDAYGPPAADRPDRPYNRHAMNNSVNRGKLSCTLDVRTPQTKELFLRLVEHADVVVENYKRGTLHQMGLWEDELCHRNPRLILLQLPPAGLAGDWADYIGFGAQFDALSGIAALVGRNDSEIAEAPSTFHMDTVTGPAGAFAVLAALHYRAATGRGQKIELAQTDNLLHQLGDVLVDCQQGTEPERLGNRDRVFAPQGVYPCRDGQWLAVSVRDDEEWAALCAAMEAPELADDPRYSTVGARRAAHDELDKVIGAWTQGHDAAGLFPALQAAGVPAAPVLDEPGLAADPHVAARRWIAPLPCRDTATFDHIGSVVRGVPVAWERGAPALGEHNAYVYQEILGLSDAEYQRLIDEKIAVEDYLDRDGNPV